MSEGVDRMTGDAMRSLVDQQEKWLRGLGVETEEDARLIAKDWLLEAGPVEFVDEGGNHLKATQVVRMVRRTTNAEKGTK